MGKQWATGQRNSELGRTGLSKGKTLHSHSASPRPGVKVGISNLMLGVTAMDYHPIQGEQNYSLSHFTSPLTHQRVGLHLPGRLGQSHICANPCKIGTGISPGSRQDSRRSPGSHRDGPFCQRDPFWEKFPPRILARIPPRNLYSQGSRQEKTLLQDPGENPAGKQNLDGIRGENLILAQNLILPQKFPPRSCTFSLLERISRRGCIKPDLDI